jgi:hypothetical protein
MESVNEKLDITSKNSQQSIEKSGRNDSSVRECSLLVNNLTHNDI